MAGVIEAGIIHARELLASARTEFENAQQERRGAALTGLRNSCGKGWLAALEAADAFFVKQGVADGELPRTDRGRRYFSASYMSRDMRRAFVELRQTFHIDGYYEVIVGFDDMPGYLAELEEFIDQIEAIEGDKSP